MEIKGYFKKKRTEEQNTMKHFFKSLWTIVWKITVFFIIWGLLLLPVIAWAHHSGKIGSEIPSIPRLIIEAACLITILIASWVRWRWIDRRQFRLGFSREHALRDLFLGLVFGFGMLAFSMILLWMMHFLKWKAGSVTNGNALAISALTLLFNAAMQEMIVRAYIFQILMKNGGRWLAVILTSVVFVFLHDFNGVVMPAVNLFLIAFFLAWSIILTRNLWLAISYHFIWNFLLGPVTGLAVSGFTIDSGWGLAELSGAPIWTGGSFGPEGGFAVTISIILSMGVLIVLFRKGGQHEY
jgi:membrane protease YdiL (CAAX protease family)